MSRFHAGLWSHVLVASIALLVATGVAMWNEGIVADENGLTNGFGPSLLILAGFGVLGLLISLPAWLASAGSRSK